MPKAVRCDCQQKMVVHNIIIYLQFITIVAEKAPLLQFAIAPAFFG